MILFLLLLLWWNSFVVAGTGTSCCIGDVDNVLTVLVVADSVFVAVAVIFSFSSSVVLNLGPSVVS